MNLTPISINSSANAPRGNLVKSEIGLWIVIFPEGTRVAPGETKRYGVGGAWLSTHTGTPVLPVAHNAGEYWPRNGFLKYPGTITVSIGAPIDPAGMKPAVLNEKVQTWIEAEMEQIHHRDNVGLARD